MKLITKAAMVLGAAITAVFSGQRILKRIADMECSPAMEDRLRKEWEDQQAKAASNEQK